MKCDMRFSARHLHGPRQDGNAGRCANNPSQTLCRSANGQFPCPPLERSRRRRRANGWTDLALACRTIFDIRSHILERYSEGILPEGQPHPGLASATTSLNPITTSSNTSPGFPQGRNIKGQMQHGRHPLRGRTCWRGVFSFWRTSDAPRSGLLPGDVDQAATGLACIRFPARPPIFGSPKPTPYGSAWRIAPIADSANASRPNYFQASQKKCVVQAAGREPTLRTGPTAKETNVTKVIKLSNDGRTATASPMFDRDGEGR